MTDACHYLNRVLVASVLMAFGLGWAAAQAADIPAIPDGVRWGETSRTLLEQLGTRATVLARPIDFGDSYADVVLRHVALGAVPMTAFFQMDKATGGLKRVQFVRQPHGVNPPAYRAVVAALDAAYGRPSAICAIPADAASGYQAAVEVVWRRDAMTIRAIFRDTTIEAFEGCLWWWMTPPCGLIGQMLVRFAPQGADRPACPVPASS
jgi:hypothetical protein